MKTKFLALFAVVALVSGAQFTQAAAVSVSVFYDALEPYGEWRETSDYGYVWNPRDVDSNWRPYTVGSWAHTDAGWTWVSEEPFGWATYHYGRWVEIERVGWCWVPGREWGPAWVSWRRSDRYVGWAPLPPEARFEVRIGFREWTDSYYDIGPTYYSFVSVRDFGAPRLRTVIIEPRENITIINETRNITNITYVNNIIVNEGPQYDVMVRDSAQPIRRLKLERRTDIELRGGAERTRMAAEISGDTLRLPAPEVQMTADAAPRKVAPKLERVSVDRGWKKAGDPQAAEKARAKIASEAQPPAELPPIAKLPGSDRKDSREREAATAESATRPGEPAAAPTAKTPERDMKPGAKAPPSASAVDEEKAAAERAKGATAEKAKPGMKDSPTAQEGKEKAQTPGVAEVPAESSREGKRPEAGVAREKPAREEDLSKKGVTRQKPATDEKAPPVAAGPDREAEKPDAAARERMPKRPEARATEESRQQSPAEPRPETEKPKKRALPEAEKPAREPESASKQQAPADRPEAARPDSAERPERKGPPAAREDRGPERSKPEASDRSAESRPPTPESRPAEAPKKGAGAEKSEKSEKRGDREEKKEN